jgi:F-type H+-transporting ATPase subunit gamma
MAKSHKIKQVMKSTEKTAVITQAMELVSASKLPQVLSRLEHTKPFSNLADQMMADYSQYSNLPHFRDHGGKNHLIIVLGTDRGLCGSLNLNLFKKVVKTIAQLETDGKDVYLALSGNKAIQFFSGYAKVIGHVDHIGDRPKIKDIMALMNPVLTAFEKKEIDCIHIAGNKFESTLSQIPYCDQVLPKPVESAPEYDHYVYEPNQLNVVSTLFRHYTESLIYRAVIENITCEQASRMIAMKSATDNAKDIIRDLKLTYNKIRQALITQEIAEISAGAHYADGETL